MPSDLKGMPVTDHASGRTRYYPPSELPESGEGILLLDELVQAVPTMQGIAQQLLVARRLGEYELPDGWMVMGLGNRKEDHASVFEMPAQVENRFRHYLITPSLTDWQRWAFRTDAIHDHILAFLNFRPELLHKYDRDSRSWPSPRTWHMASDDYRHGHSIIPSVGRGPGMEFMAFVEVYQNLPSLEAIMAGNGQGSTLPTDPSALYALAHGLALRSDTREAIENSFSWMRHHLAEEWTALFISTLVARATERNERDRVLSALTSIDGAHEFFSHLNQLAADA